MDLTAASRDRLRAYLAGRRRARVAGVLVAAGIGLFASVPDDRVELGFVPLLVGWFAGAVAVELAQRSGGIRVAHPGQAWSRMPVALGVVTVLWTMAAVLLRSEGVRYETLLGWGSGALATALVLGVMVRLASRSGLREAEPELASATSADAVRGLTVGGMTLALLGLAQSWMRAVPGPYTEAAELYPAVWLVCIAMLAFAINTATTWDRRRASTWCAVALIAAVPIAWAAPVRLAQEPPLRPQEARPSAHIRVVRLDAMPAARAELGLEPDPLQLPHTAKPESLPTALIGRVDVTRPAPAGASYQLFAFDRRTNAAITLYGADGALWHGRWSLVLPARYPWLSSVIGRRDANGFTHNPSAASPDPESGLLWFHGLLPDTGPYSADDLQLVLMLVRHGDSFVYWATPV
ncbi:hypothetical protein [Allorhizocola rhizosphaerae]|uniref:hypothetical protein n=1 Tax=Allorhizocola rhizosphaerae TaxID=1872709 RepID=UPI000E3E5FF2|nr:hypothetical protein [Allorhizocola rhizosphaerae]